MTRLSLLAAVLFATPLLAADPATDVEKLPDGAKVVKLEARPTAIDLTSPFAYAQLLLTATLDNGDVQDATRLATLDLPANVTQSAGLVRPKADGSGKITASLGGKSVTVPVTVQPLEIPGWSQWSRVIHSPSEMGVTHTTRTRTRTH